MSVSCIFYIKTIIDRVKLNQILNGTLVTKPYGDHAETLDEAPFWFFCQNDLYQTGNDDWHEYSVKHMQLLNATICKVRVRKFRASYSLYDCNSDVDDYYEDTTIIEIEEVPS